MSIWKSIGHFFGNLFQKVQHVAEEYAPKAIELVNNIKAFDTTNPEAADLITKIIPGTWDDDLKAKARVALPNVLKELGVANECAQITDINAFLKCVLDKINGLAPEITGIIQAVYHEVEKQKKEEMPEPVQS